MHAGCHVEKFTQQLIQQRERIEKYISIFILNIKTFVAPCKFNHRHRYDTI